MVDWLHALERLALKPLYSRGYDEQDLATATRCSLSLSGEDTRF